MSPNSYNKLSQFRSGENLSDGVASGTECSRRDFLTKSAAIVGLTALSGSVFSQVASASSPQAAIAMTVYKDPDCGCCTEWVKHVRKAGFAVTVRETRDTETVKSSFGVPAALVSCHTAKVDKYVIEGHVPADLIKKLLQEKPVALGLAVPGMPAGSPGMEMGSRKDPYDIVLFEKSGKTRVYASR